MYEEFEGLTNEELIEKAKYKLKKMKEASVLRLDLEACKLFEVLVERLKKTIGD